MARISECAAECSSQVGFIGNGEHWLFANRRCHLLEHLYHEEAKRLLQECPWLLKPAGILRLVVPNLEAIVAEYTGADSFAGNGGWMNFVIRESEEFPIRFTGHSSCIIRSHLYTAFDERAAKILGRMEFRQTHIGSLPRSSVLAVCSSRVACARQASIG